VAPLPPTTPLARLPLLAAKPELNDFPLADCEVEEEDMVGGILFSAVEFASMRSGAMAEATGRQQRTPQSPLNNKKITRQLSSRRSSQIRICFEFKRKIKLIGGGGAFD